jgi:RNA polymerase sigma-70 factor (ECF subfamily)
LGNDIWRQEALFYRFNHPGIQLENKEKSEILFYAAINTLPEHSRMFIQQIQDGQATGHQEVSDITKSISSIESLLFRAKKEFRDFYTIIIKTETG